MSSFPLTNSIIFQDGYCTKQVKYLYKISKINITQLSSMISILCFFFCPMTFIFLKMVIKPPPSRWNIYLSWSAQKGVKYLQVKYLQVKYLHIIFIYWNIYIYIEIHGENLTIPGLLEADVVTYGAVMTSCQTSDQWWRGGATGPVMELGISKHLGKTFREYLGYIFLGIFFREYFGGILRT